jgi:hypothetical protein
VIFAGVQQRDRRIGRFDNDGFASEFATHSHRGGTIGEFHAQGVVIQFFDREPRVLIQMYRCRVHLQLGARVLVYPQSIARGQRAVEYGVGEFIGTGGRERNFPLQQAEARDPAGGILVFRQCQQGYGQSNDEQQLAHGTPMGAVRAIYNGCAHLPLRRVNSK